MTKLTTDFIGLRLKNPLIAASSGLTNQVEDLLEFEQAGVGAVVLKSLFEEEIRIEMEGDMARMHNETFLYPETMDFYDNFEMVEDMLTGYLKLISDAKKVLSIPVVASINCVTAEKWPYYVSTLQDAGADALELNVFSLPSDLTHAPEKDEQLYFDIIHAVQKQAKIPILLKISSYSSNLAALIHQLSKTGISGIVLFNRFYSPDIDIDNLQVQSTHIYSTPDEMALPLRWIALMSGRVDCDLIASTGIHNGEAMIKQLLAGATAVEVASAFYKHGKMFASEMLATLNNWMDEKGFKTLKDFRGMMDYARTQNPAAYERTQFMKHFSGKEMK